ncbi:hypothetical protein [Aliivibrio kagoshimensis]|uniref:hypothetical protein n=1 Tax=Aliivibrio kagoshimensis TaxID=2910230 RepID=UPI003D0BC91E
MKIVIMLIIMLLNGCGGGGGGSTAASPATPAASSESIYDLVIAAENSLEAVYTLTLDIDVSALSTQKSVVSICDDSSSQGEYREINYQTCLFQASFHDGEKALQLRIPNHVQQLIAVIWFLDGNQEPVVAQRVNNEVYGSHWSISY